MYSWSSFEHPGWNRLKIFKRFKITHHQLAHTSMCVYKTVNIFTWVYTIVYTLQLNPSISRDYPPLPLFQINFMQQKNTTSPHIIHPSLIIPSWIFSSHHPILFPSNSPNHHEDHEDVIFPWPRLPSRIDPTFGCQLPSLAHPERPWCRPADPERSPRDKDGWFPDNDVKSPWYLLCFRGIYITHKYPLDYYIRLI